METNGFMKTLMKKISYGTRDWNVCMFQNNINYFKKSYCKYRTKN